MKKMIAIAMMIVATTIALILNYYNNLYTMNATVVTNYNGWYMVEDETGNLWEFDDDSQYFEIGEKVTVTMNRNGSYRYIYDDEIKKVEKGVDR